MLRSLFVVLLVAVGVSFAACVTTFDGVFANPCPHQLRVAVHYGDPEIFRSGERHLIIESDLEPLTVTRIPQAFEDPEAERFTVAIEGSDVLVEVSGSNRREASSGEFFVVIPAEVCAP